ncbi:unnamed protein product [Staurois parvus]|uniref:Uncharacterized protein n=1 Tax=Staurois parvus TaxID=386267 RepID=A0ABN9G558_9NEOB|nr:unnamed protein product [Staurois parvus]
MDGRVVSVVRRAKSATCGQQGIKGAGREWSRSQAGFSNSQTDSAVQRIRQKDGQG